MNERYFYFYLIRHSYHSKKLIPNDHRRHVKQKTSTSKYLFYLFHVDPNIHSKNDIQRHRYLANKL